MKVILLGMGSGAAETLTVRAWKALCASRAVIGAPRLLESLPPECGARRFAAVAAEEILELLRLLNEEQAAPCNESALKAEERKSGSVNRPEVPAGGDARSDAAYGSGGDQREDFGGHAPAAMAFDGGCSQVAAFGGSNQAAVVFSGDSGFYSGARLLLPLLLRQGYEAEVLPGISSVQMLSAKLGRPWQDWRLVSVHGADCDVVAEVMGGTPVLFLTGGSRGPAALCARLAEAGLDGLPITVGENLFLPGEAIVQGTAGEMAGRTFAPLSVLLTEPASLMPRHAPGWPDDWFIRGQVPMTKRFVRAAALAKLDVSPRDICWDVGAGTGSVSIELASLAGRVYAVECMPDACDLIRQNRSRHNAWNLTLVEGRAPGALKDLPAPDAVLIGGSRGELSAIVDAVLEKNHSARLCITAIAVETLHAAMNALAAHGMEAEVAQISVSQGKAAGSLHLLTANNPVFLITGNCR